MHGRRQNVYSPNDGPTLKTVLHYFQSGTIMSHALWLTSLKQALRHTMIQKSQMGAVTCLDFNFCVIKASAHCETRRIFATDVQLTTGLCCYLISVLKGAL